MADYTVSLRRHRSHRALDTQGRQMDAVNVGRRPRRILDLVGQTDILRDDFVSS